MGRWPLERHVLTKSLKKTCLSNVRSTFGSNLPITGTKFYRRINYFDVKRMRRLLSLHRRGAFRAVSSTTTTGFPLVLQRCAGIMQNIAEITMNKVLYIHCDRGDGLIQHLGKSTKFAISACTFDSRIIDECKNIKQYTDVELLHSDNTDTVLPYRNRSFQIVVSLHPLHYSVDNHVIDGRIVSVSELNRVVNDDGYVIIGVPEQVWNEHNVLQEIEDTNELSVLAIQSVDCNFEDGKVVKYYVASVRKVGWG